MTTPHQSAPAPTTDRARSEPPAESPTHFAVRGLGFVAIAYFVGGPIGAGVALAGVLATWRRPAGLVAAASAAMLGVAALATVFEVTPRAGNLRSNFADVRPIASASGLAAGMLALVAVGTLAFRERATRPAPAPAVDPGPRGWRWLLADEQRSAVMANLPLAALTVVGGVVRAVIGTDPLPGALDQLASNLRNGAGYVLGDTAPFQATGEQSPVPALLGAFGPGGGSFALVVATMVAVAVAGVLGTRLGGRQLALGAALATIVLLVATNQALGPTVATAALLSAAILGLDRERPDGRVALSGLALALAVLAEPWAIIAIPFLAFWLGFGRSRDHQGSFRAALLALVVLVVALYPWQRYLVTRFDTFAPSTAMSLTLGSVGVFGALALVAALTILGSRLPASD